MAEILWSATLKPDMSSILELPQHVLPCFATKAQGMNAMLACDEVFANIALYSGATVVDVEIRQTGREVLIIFSDDGVPFNPLVVEPSQRGFEDLDEGGMGIMLVRQVCSDIDYEYSGGRNILTLHFCAGESGK